MAEIFRKKQHKKNIFLTLGHMGLRSDLSWPKLDLEPKFHDHGTFGGFGKQITNQQDSGFMSIDRCSKSSCM